ncbi:Tropomyosin alpha-1 chain [Stylophora pistillata]|uniref:Tropomyosin alpha-1 chain n=1 Tax=Stylophora pistillata TaxID=50429 RepID=A0A2B4SQQ6_STYPI|nr:Tropomyosin alpha-1 chain [Stylophora pistillata]
MEEFKAKTSRYRHEIDQAEEREKSAIKKLAFANHDADEKEKERDALKRRKRLLEQKLDAVEDRIFDKDKFYREELARKEREDRQRKILDELEEEDERKFEKLEAEIRRYEKAADYSEHKCAECRRRLQTVTRETERFKMRLRVAVGKGRELEEQNKFVGRHLRKLEISEEKRGDREEAFENKIRELWQLRRDQEMRFETAERTIGRLEREKSALKEKLYEENQKLNDKEILKALGIKRPRFDTICVNKEIRFDHLESTIFCQSLCLRRFTAIAKEKHSTFKMVFGVIGFGLTSTALLITFGKYFAKDWFGYFMFGLILFEVLMFTLTKGKTIAPERPPTRTEKTSSNRPASPPASPKAASSAKASNQSPKNQGSNKQEKAAEKTARKAQAKEAKAEAKAAAAAK